MKSILASALLAALIGVTGCNNANKAGGPGATPSTAKKPVSAESESTFTLDPPSLATKLKQGESKTVTIGIKRSKGFGQDVALGFDNLPKGVTIEPAAPSIKAGTEEAKFAVHTSADAALGEFVIKVIGRPSTGADASNEFKIVIEKK